MITVTPIKSFDHDGVRRIGVPFDCSERTAEALVRAKLVSLGGLDEQNPSLAVASLSASLPAHPSPQTIVQPSNSGAKRGRKKGR